MREPLAARVPGTISGPIEGVLADPGVWDEVRRLAHTVDARLDAASARLTFGWEPTFVSARDRQSQHWWTDPLGLGKRAAAGAFGRALLRRCASGGVLVLARGKTYPGEAEPRWTLAGVWRRDGASLSRDRGRPASATTHPEPASADARRFLLTLADRLGLPRFHVAPAFEAGRTGEESMAPDAAPLAGPAGFVLPLGARRGWRSEAWRLPEGPLTLAPGALPIGFRLPRERLAATGHRLADAVSAEPHSGGLSVCLPTLGDTTRWLELVSAVELTAAELAQPLALAGHAPAASPLTGRFDIAPDPGVLEVNLPPAKDWDAWEARVADLYAAAAEAGMDARRFLLNGRTVGTGGGGHILLGGASPDDSPFRRRPEALARMLAYWHNHPSLSYAFAGSSVGPFSQYPRVDESRADAVCEFEVALAELARGHPAPHLAMRHILVDPTGNPHRAEFCIDKLGPPAEDRALGGLLELRAFDTQPTARMSLLVHLLVRALFVALWERPYRAPLTQWGPRLHDAFMLPAVLRADLDAVLGDLAAVGLRFDPAWFEPLWEARFPVVGRAWAEGVTLELRAALEPWIALGETGATRLVDSSIERLQVRLSGTGAGRCAVCCSGRLLPLRPFGAEGAREPPGDPGPAFGTGLRFRAWAPFDGLHPGIAAHAPLVFEVIERAGGRRLMRCVYHAVAPDGADYPGYPDDAAEAARRRAARFLVTSLPGETGRAPAPPAVESAPALPRTPERPFTADMCRTGLGIPGG